jgi:FKBP-type peptidyl-prolyl cis-trans isomerase 2
MAKSDDERRPFMTQDLVPGMLVHHPQRPDWGLGQVQSAIGNRVTVNFEHAGKVLINTAVISLTPVETPTGD